VVEYSYDVFDRRVGKDVDDDGDQDVDRGERYVYDGGFLPSPAAGRGAGGEGACENIVLQFDGADNLTHRYLFGPAVDQVLADEDASGDVSWLLADHEGTIRDVAQYNSGTDQTTVVNHLKYDAFGNITSQTNSTFEPHFAFTGRDWDPDAGLYYYRARWYDPHTGRFLSQDPSGFKAGDTNLNRYVWNRPTSLTDPTGLEQNGSGGYVETSGGIINRTVLSSSAGKWGHYEVWFGYSLDPAVDPGNDNIVFLQRITVSGELSAYNGLAPPNTFPASGGDLGRKSYTFYEEIGRGRSGNDRNAQLNELQAATVNPRVPGNRYYVAGNISIAADVRAFQLTDELATQLDTFQRVKWCDLKFENKQSGLATSITFQAGPMKDTDSFNWDRYTPLATGNYGMIAVWSGARDNGKVLLSY
jgi:RHS repeat-associated protein